MAEVIGRFEEQTDTLAEERRFLMANFNYDDRQVAARLGWDWASYRTYFRRHPELGPIVDREQDERTARAEENRRCVGIATAAARRKRTT